jgi:alpha-1,3-rhamnosyl/mannosyltransferase
MRILLDARTIQDHFPGIGRYVYNLALALAPELDGDLWLLVNYGARNTQYDLDILARNPGIQLIPTDITVRHWREQTHLPGLIRSFAPDLVHFPYFVRPLRVAIPTILTLYDVIPRRFPAYFPGPSRLSIELLKRLALRSSDAFVAISETTSTDFQRWYGIPSERITVTPLAPDPIFRPQSSWTIADLRQRLDLPERYALYLGSNKPHKNLPRLIEAWGRYQKSESVRGDESPTTRLVIAGAWDRRYSESKQLVEHLHLSNSVRFLGSVDNRDLPALYAGADLFIFPSLYEGFGLPVLEAMACGTPVACSNTSSLPKIAGDAALRFDPTNTGEMAAAIQQILADKTLHRRLSVFGREQVTRFSWERTAQETLRAYEGVTATPNCIIV